MTISSPQTSLLDHLCPLHAVLDAEGQITSSGPTLNKIVGGDPQGPILDLFDLRRPTGLTDPQTLVKTRTDRLLLSPKTQPDLKMKGVLHPMQGGAVLNLSFGLSVREAVQAYDLTQHDFPETDLTVEMLYMIEANTLAMTAAIDVTRRLQSARQRAESASHTDQLTGLLNRRGLEVAVDALKEGTVPCALVLMDLDHFKSVNDTLGHAAGDRVLEHVANLLRRYTRQNDVVARCGGDEFTLLIPEITAQDLSQRLDALISAVSAPIEFEGQMCRIGASAGWSVVDAAELKDFENLVKITDEALYAAKQSGRSCHRPAQVAQKL